jgi:hypothetical protein
MRGLHAHTEGFPGDTDEFNNWDVDGPEKWIIAKLQWDPFQDPAALRDEYINRTYQDAAPKMREFYQLINDSWHDATNDASVNCHASAKELFQTFIVKPRLEKHARALLEEAQSVATNPKSQKMIQRTLARFDAYAESLNRLVIPLVPESTEQWSDHASGHWYKALSISDFTRVANWQPLPEDKSAKHKTTVSIMRDRENIYFKIDASVADALPAKPISRADTFPHDDRVEIVLRSGGSTYYLAVGADGGTYLLKNWNASLPWKTSTKVKYFNLEYKWTALLAVPFSDLELNAEKPDLDGQFCRVVAPRSPDREESTYSGRGIFNNHELLRNPLQFEK